MLYIIYNSSCQAPVAVIEVCMCGVVCLHCSIIKHICSLCQTSTLFRAHNYRAALWFLSQKQYSYSVYVCVLLCVWLRDCVVASASS